MCAQLDKDGPSLTFAAQRLITICRKVRFSAHRLIVRLITRGLEMRARAGHRSSGRN
jgi:hypothetical protein